MTVMHNREKVVENIAKVGSLKARIGMQKAYGS
ncbi:MAG: hypothetical protein JSC189_001236 [Candidatus Tokpelaia sp. JSC189]|nr:MAG: hypothetical protein JSC189_001236 [Candidatus Tokpelaia sp. JSC189]